MNEATVMILRRSVWLWIGTALVVTFNSLAAIVGGVTFVFAALIVNGLFALIGIGFGLWVGRTVSKNIASLSPSSRP